MNQTALAERPGKHQHFVSKYESGERRLDFIEVLDVAKILGLTAESLLINIGESDE